VRLRALQDLRPAAVPLPTAPAAWDHVLAALAALRREHPQLLAAHAAYFDTLLTRDTAPLDHPRSATIAALSPRQLYYMAGLREGLLRGKLALDVLEEMAREREAPGGPPRHALPDEPSTPGAAGGEPYATGPAATGGSGFAWSPGPGGNGSTATLRAPRQRLPTVVPAANPPAWVDPTPGRWGRRG
jgi:hypothetical protein